MDSRPSQSQSVRRVDLAFVRRTIRGLALSGAAALLLASLYQPVGVFESSFTGTTEIMRGWSFMRLGWQGPLYGHWAWFANPLMLAGWAALSASRPGVATVLCGLSALVASTHVRLWTLPIPQDAKGFGAMHMVELESGFYLWTASIALSFAASAYLWWTRDPTRAVG